VPHPVKITGTRDNSSSSNAAVIIAEVIAAAIVASIARAATTEVLEAEAAAAEVDAVVAIATRTTITVCIMMEFQRWSHESKRSLLFVANSKAKEKIIFFKLPSLVSTHLLLLSDP